MRTQVRPCKFRTYREAKMRRAIAGITGEVPVSRTHGLPPRRYTIRAYMHGIFLVIEPSAQYGSLSSLFTASNGQEDLFQVRQLEAYIAVPVSDER